MNKKFFLYFLIFFLNISNAYSDFLINEIIDIPTANVIDHRGYLTTFKFFGDGSTMACASFGIYNLNVGFNWQWEYLLGSQSVDYLPPTIILKLKVFQGGQKLPAISLGYDGQGYYYDKKNKDYTQKEKGVYITATKNILLDEFEWSFGFNIFDFASDKVFTFTGFSYLIENKISLLLELDSIHQDENFKNTRLNSGIRIFLNPQIGIDFFGRDLKPPKDRKTERILRIRYESKF